MGLPSFFCWSATNVMIFCVSGRDPQGENRRSLVECAASQSGREAQRHVIGHCLFQNFLHEAIKSVVMIHNLIL